MEQARIAAHLAKSSEGGKDRDPAAAEADLPDGFVDFSPALVQDFPVERRLARIHLAVRDALGFRRQIARHFILQTSEQEWANPPSKPVAGRGIVLQLDRLNVSF